MGWSGAVRSIAGRGNDDVGSGRWGTLLARHPADVGSSTHALHDSPVASGESGGPLLDARGRVFGVHSFGDAFYGGERDVAVVVTRDRMVEMERAAEAAARAEEAEETRGCVRGIRDGGDQSQSVRVVGSGVGGDVPRTHRGAETRVDIVTSTSGASDERGSE